MNNKPLRLTRRGKTVVGIFILTLVSLFTYATRDTCWTGNGYGSCSQWIDQVIEHGHP